MPTKEELLAKAQEPAQRAMRLHALYQGKVQTLPKCPIRDPRDFTIWYTPGVAAPCKAIQEDPSRSYEFTNRANTIAIVSDGTRVLGLGDIGPEAGLPVIEGTALLFKYLGGIDAVPICLGTKDPDEIVRRVKGGIGEALKDADVCIAFSTPGPGIISPEWVKTMASNAIIFACANPVPEIWPWEAKEAGARIIATGRSRSTLNDENGNSIVMKSKHFKYSRGPCRSMPLA